MVVHTGGLDEFTPRDRGSGGTVATSAVVHATKFSPYDVDSPLEDDEESESVSALVLFNCRARQTAGGIVVGTGAEVALLTRYHTTSKLSKNM